MLQGGLINNVWLHFHQNLPKYHYLGTSHMPKINQILRALRGDNKGCRN